MRKLLLVMTLLATASLAHAAPGTTKKNYGKMPDGKTVEEYTMVNAKGTTIKVITLGGIVTELLVADKDGKLGDIALGCSNLEEYLEGHPFFGALVGRVGNRIAKGKFTLDGKAYTLAVNNGDNHLHGGKVGFDKVIWKAVPLHFPEGQALQLSYTSKDGEEGYPGKLDVTVTYVLTDKNEWTISYAARTDKATPINLTQHCYFNLAGHNSGEILGHELTLSADEYTPTDEGLIPTGKIESVKGTPFDFTSPTLIGMNIKEIKATPVGYDLNYVLRKGNGLREAAKVVEPTSGRVMTVFTTQPGVQLYSGNFLDGKQKGKGGVMYKQYSGFCLETQHYPDSINQKDFPSVVLKPNEVYLQKTEYRFSTVK